MEENVIKLKNELKEKGITGLALDIDETLSDTGPHWWNHMLKFHRPDDLTQEELLEKYDHIEAVPGWDTKEAVKYINDTLESNEFSETIPLLHESNKMVVELNKIVPIVAYVTARPESVKEGTERWFLNHKFPKAPLILR